MGSRRQFIVHCSIVAAASLLPGVGAGVSLCSAGSSEELSLETFVRYVGTSFEVEDEQDGMVKLELASAGPIPSPARAPEVAEGAGWESFSLIFRGQSSQPLSQRSYDFEHGEMGRFRMFIVPIGRPQDGGRRYQAIFYRRRIRA